MKNYKGLLLVGLVIAIAGALGFFYKRQPQQINSFAQCAAAGYPILQSYPEQCKTPDGRTFTNTPTSGQSGVSGSVLLGPQCPVVRDGQCPDKPYQTDLVVTAADGQRVIAQFRSDQNGAFRVSLAPGQYLIRSVTQTRPYCSSGSLTVSANTYTNTTVHCDTGIR